MLRGLPSRVGLTLSKIDNPEACSNVLDDEIYEILQQLKNYDYDPEVYKKRALEKAKIYEARAEEEI